MFLKSTSKEKPNLIEDPIMQLFIKIAVPSSVGTIFMTLYNVVDTFFAGKISAEALAALAQTFPVYFIIIALGVGLSIGTTSLIANAIGEKEDTKASYYLAQSIILAIIAFIIVSLVGIYLGPSIILIMNDSLVIMNLSMDYLNIIFLGSIFIFIQMTVNSSLTAMGDTKSNRNVLIVSFFLNIFLNPLFIFGYGFIPAMGIKGIALSTIASQALGTLYILYKVTKTDLSKYLYLNCFKPKFIILIDLLKQGIPASLGMMMISVGVFIILFFIGQYGDLALAGYGTAIRYEQLYLLPVLGLNTAVLSMVGQNFGAKKINRINEIYNKALLFGCGFMFCSAFIIYFSAETAVGLFTNNRDVIKYGTTYLQITALMEPVYPIFFISNALIQGLKKANIVMYLSLGRMVILPIIVLWYLIFYLESSFEFVFWGLLIINWIYGIFVLLFTKSILNKQSKNINFSRSGF
ncbi:MATE family efflux transporter [Alphaproteobacteria bacterium]|nr:MATE family efflux transporter [Alphaproteobacteria bacterium]